jgi:integrase
MPRANTLGIKGLHRSADGRYRIDLRFRDSTGANQRFKERLPLGTTLGMARTRAQIVLGDVLAGRMPQPVGAAASGTSLNSALDEYLRWVETNRPKRVRNARSLKSVWLATAGDVASSSIDASLCERFKKMRRAGGAAPATINRGVAFLKHAARTAVRLGWSWMTAERAAAIGAVGMLREPPGRQRPIRPSELRAILSELGRPEARFIRRIVTAALLTGCRMGELRELTESDVDFRRKRVDLSATKQNRRHEVVITPELEALLQEALAEPARAKTKSKHVFVTHLGTAYTGALSQYFAKIAERAGCDDVTFHDLRRHVGTALINAGTPVEVVSKVLGHSTIGVTLRSYAHVSGATAADAFGKLPSLAGIAPALPPGKKRGRKYRKNKAA